MSFTTANKKSNEYNEEHILYIGSHTGSFKKIDISQENPYQELQIEQVDKLEKKNGITSLSWSNPKQKSEILLGREDGVVKVFDMACHSLTKTWKLEAKIMGIGKYDEKLIAATESGEVHILAETSTEPVETLNLSGDNISRLRQCADEMNLIATGGNERKNNLKIINLDTKTVIFSTKNLPNDELDLEVPVWDTDFAFLTPTTVSSCSRHGYVRVYDTKMQRRPVLNYKNDKEQISYISMTSHGHQIIVGTNLGVVRGFDRRSMKTPIHTYKGFVGSVSSLAMDSKGKYFVAGSLDRYVRVYDVESPAALYQCYVKSKVNQVLLQDIKQESLDKNDEEILRERNNIENDPEYEEMFNNMQTVAEENEKNTSASLKMKRKNGDDPDKKPKKKGKSS